jgi:hypothetical protein
MRSVETSVTFPLSSVKPLEKLREYRTKCLEWTRQAQSGPTTQRSVSPATGGPVEPYANIDGLSYVRCRQTGSLFLEQMPAPTAWSELLRQVMQYRHSPDAFHAEISGSRNANVVRPKLDWLEQTLRIQGFASPNILEITTAPSDLAASLSRNQTNVIVLDEMTFLHQKAPLSGQADAAILFESLDRVDDPAGLMTAVYQNLRPGGLVFVTALVSSGFDMAVLGARNLYFYPPDRANCFSRSGLEALATRTGFQLIEVSTPGVLDVEIVQSHRKQDSALPLSGFERELLDSGPETREAFQSFLQQQGLSSFARLVGRKS